MKECVDEGTPAERVAFVSFTRAAANEALSRLGLKRSENVSTIHAMAFRSLGLRQSQVVDASKLREFSAAVGVPIMGKSPEDDEERADGDFYLDILNYARNTFNHPDAVYDVSDRPGTRAEFSTFVDSYAEWKKTYGYCDFTDMLERAAKGAVRSDAQVVFIDEAQDLSPLQWRVIERAVKGAQDVHVAGDDDQAIYGWAGADAHGIARFVQKHDGEHRVLSESHRLPVAVHAKSQALIRRIVFRVDKEFRPKQAEGSVTFHGSIHSARVKHGEDTLVLARTHSVLREFERWMLDTRQPYSRQSGRPGMFQNRYAAAVRAYRAFVRGETLTDTQRNALYSSATDRTRARVESEDRKSLERVPFYAALIIPDWMVNYYADVDLEQRPTIRLSTIHAAKGHEADRVVLLTGMTTRVGQSADKNPDDEVRVWYVGMTRSKNTLDIVEGYNGFKI